MIGNAEKSIKSFMTGAELAIVFGPNDINNIAQILDEQYRLCPLARIHCILPAGSIVQLESIDNPLIREITCLHNFPEKDFNHGSFWLCALKAIKYDGRPLAVMQAKSVLTKNWAQRLAHDCLNLASRTGITTCCISAVGLRHEVNRLADADISSGCLTVDAIDQWLNEYSDGDCFDTPELSFGASILIGAQLSNQLESIKSDKELFQLLSAQGPMLSSSHVLVDDRQLDQKYLLSADSSKIKQKSQRSAHPLNALGHSISELNQRGEQPPSQSDGGPVQLHVAHSWGGGLGRWVKDYIDADIENRNLVLRPIGTWGAFGQTLALYRNGNMDVPIEKWTLAQSISSTAIYHSQYAKILNEIVDKYRIEKLCVSSFIGQSLDVLRVGLPTTLVLHDYYPFCPALVARFDSPCNSCNSTKQAECNSHNPLHKFFDNEDNLHWDLLRLEYKKLLRQESIKIVAPTQSVSTQFQSLLEEVNDNAILVIPHGLPEDQLVRLGELRMNHSEDSYDGKRKLRVVVLGSLVEIKGLNLFRQALDQMLEFCDVFLIGCGDSGREFSGVDGVTVVSSYQSIQLPSVLKEHKPDLGLLLSIVPETFSYTLSELWASGLPVMATNLGAYRDRIEHDHNGWLVEPEPRCIVQQLQRLSRNSDLLKATNRNVTEATPMKSVDMAAAYQQLHDSELVDLSKRYCLARKTHHNPYLTTHEQTRQSAIHIDHQVSYRMVLLDFLSYSRGKVSGTDKLQPWLRGLLGKLHGLLIKLIRP